MVTDKAYPRPLGLAGPRILSSMGTARRWAFHSSRLVLQGRQDLLALRGRMLPRLTPNTFSRQPRTTQSNNNNHSRAPVPPRTCIHRAPCPCNPIPTARRTQPPRRTRRDPVAPTTSKPHVSIYHDLPAPPGPSLLLSIEVTVVVLLCCRGSPTYTRFASAGGSCSVLFFLGLV